MPDAVFSSKAASALALELGVRATDITGTGRGGKITLDDVRAAAPPPPPDGLGDAGRAFWRAVRPNFELRPDEELLLREACRTIDELRRIETDLSESPLTVKGSKGQIRPNPLIAEVRAHRLALKQIIATLGLPDSDDDERADPFQQNGAARSAAGRQLALLRHGGRGG